MAPLPPGAPFGIYLHVPFCAHICPYCDFNTYAGQDALIPRYVAALEQEIRRPAVVGEGPAPSVHRPVVVGEGPAPSHRPQADTRSCQPGELEHFHDRDDQGRLGRIRGVSRFARREGAGPSPTNDGAVATIYLGGGTPSLLPAADIARLLRACREVYDLHPDAEITLEANPNNVDKGYFAALLDAGVNRLSLGVQTLHRRGLRTLGRQHEAADAEAAFRAARAAGFVNISLDLIFGWPGQTAEAWDHDLQTILSWNHPPEHLSLYSLIVEPGTPMADAVARGILTVLDDDQTADLYEAAMARLAAAGWTHYEVANWAREPSRASRHNAIYWRNGEYAGLGAGAHGRIGNRRTMNHLLPATYIAAVEAGDAPVSNVEELSEQTQMGETMMLGLRLLREGVRFDEFAVRHGRELTEVFGPPIDELSGLGLLDVTPERVRLTRRGLLVANEVCARFL